MIDSDECGECGECDEGGANAELYGTYIRNVVLYATCCLPNIPKEVIESSSTRI